MLLHTRPFRPRDADAPPLTCMAAAAAALLPPRGHCCFVSYRRLDSVGEVGDRGTPRMRGLPEPQIWNYVCRVATIFVLKDACFRPVYSGRLHTFSVLYAFHRSVLHSLACQTLIECNTTHPAERLTLLL